MKKGKEQLQILMLIGLLVSAIFQTSAYASELNHSSQPVFTIKTMAGNIFSLSDDGKYIAMPAKLKMDGDLGFIQEWEIRQTDDLDNHVIANFKKSSKKGYASDFSSDGRLFAYSDGELIRVGESKTGKLVTTLKGKEFVNIIGFVGDQQIISVTNNGVYRWDLTTGQREVVISGKDKEWQEKTRYLQGYCLSSDGSKLFVKSVGNIAVWNMSGGTNYTLFSGFQYDLSAVSSDGRYFSWFNCIWDTTTKQLAGQIPSLTDGVILEAFSPDGKYLVIFYTNEDVCIIWDIVEKKIVGKLALVPGKNIERISFTNNGSFLVGASWDNIYAWDWHELLGR